MPQYCIEDYTNTIYWNRSTKDNRFLFLWNEHDQVGQLPASFTEWKNMFSFKIYGRDEKLLIEGRDDSPEMQRLILDRGLPEMSPLETTCWEDAGADVSWWAELAVFVAAALEGRPPLVELPDAEATLETVAGAGPRQRLQ